MPQEEPDEVIDGPRRMADGPQNRRYRCLRRVSVGRLFESTGQVVLHLPEFPPALVVGIERLLVKFWSNRSSTQLSYPLCDAPSEWKSKGNLSGMGDSCPTRLGRLAAVNAPLPDAPPIAARNSQVCRMSL